MTCFSIALPKRLINEAKFKTLEKEKADALEMAEKEDEEGKAQKSPEEMILRS
jgi:hypothetical protein